jgi:hypothetical protein
VLRKDAQPALCNAAVYRGPFVIAIAFVERGHRLGISVCQGGLGVAHGGRHPRAPLPLGLGEPVQMGFIIKGTVRHKRGQAGGGW